MMSFYFPKWGLIYYLFSFTRGDVHVIGTYLIFLSSTNDVIYFPSRNNTCLSFYSVKQIMSAIIILPKQIITRIMGECMYKRKKSVCQRKLKHQYKRWV